MKKYIVIFIILCVTVITIVYFAFKNSYKYTDYQIKLGMKHKNPETCSFYNFEKMHDKIVERYINQRKLIDEVTEKTHNSSDDIFTLQTYENMKSSVLKNDELNCKDIFTTGDESLKEISDFKLLWLAITNQSTDLNKKITVTKINKNKYEKEIKNTSNDNSNIVIYEKINNKWMVVDNY